VIKILLVDDHALMRAGITRLLSDVSDIRVVGAANSGEEALKLIREKNPDVVLMDIKMPGIGGLEATRKCLRNDPGIKIIALTACIEEPFPTKVLQAGAKGYLSKNVEFSELVHAIRMVHADQCYIDPVIAQKMALTSVNAIENPNRFKDLSEREMQVLMMISSGDTVHTISNQLCLSPKTVNGYRYRLFEKLKVKSDVDLTHIAIRYALVTREVS
jgi:two-component system invasion response regulator UvrY